MSDAVEKKHKKHKKHHKKDNDTDTVDSTLNGGTEQTVDTAADEVVKSHKRKHADASDTAVDAADDSNDTDILQTLKKPKPSANAIPADHLNKQSTMAENGDVTRVYCGNISVKATDSDIYDLFSRSGHIVGLHWVTDKTTGNFYGSCMIDFSTKQAATTALRCNGKTLIDRVLKVSIATGIITNNNTNKQHYNSKPNPGVRILQAAPVDKSLKPDGCQTVFLGNVSFDIGDEHVTELFKDCGEITDIRWVEKDGVFKGCGFVEFNSTDAVDKAVQLNGTTLLGRKMKVDYAPNK